MKMVQKCKAQDLPRIVLDESGNMNRCWYPSRTATVIRSKGPQVFYYEASESGKALALAIQENMNRKLSGITASGGKRKQDLLSSAKSRCSQYRRMWISYKSGGSFPHFKTKYQCKVAEAVADGIITYLENRRGKQKRIEKKMPR